MASSDLSFRFDNGLDVDPHGVPMHRENRGRRCVDFIPPEFASGACRAFAPGKCPRFPGA